jgi:hypothetical protein
MCDVRRRTARSGYDPVVTARLDRVRRLCASRVPGLRVVDKHTVWWMVWLGRFIRPLVPEFSTRYTTVVGRTVFLPAPPERLPPDLLASTLAHELVHQLDQQRHPLWFYASYGFLLPVGRTMRAWWERRAYAVDLLLARERGGAAEVLRTADQLAEFFSDASYLWMWVGRARAREYLQPVVDRVLDGSLDAESPYREILAAWNGTERPSEEST